MTENRAQEFDAVFTWLEDTDDYVDIGFGKRGDPYCVNPATSINVRLPLERANDLANQLQILLEYLNQPTSTRKPTA